jgi:hypothetical protein
VEDCSTVRISAATREHAKHVRNANQASDVSLFWFPNTYFSRSKIDFVEFAGVEIPDTTQLGRPTRSSR